MHTQTLVVGAGVVGLAVTQRLARGGREVLCLEARERPAQVTSARNSGVLHAALYYPTGSLKARLCLAGNSALGRFCAAHDVPLKRVGKLIVATAPEEEAQLERLLAQARANGVTGVSRLDGAQVRRLEPHVHATAGLLSEATGILDVHALCEALERAGKDAGATLALKHRMLGGERVDGSWRVRGGQHAGGVDLETTAAWISVRPPPKALSPFGWCLSSASSSRWSARAASSRPRRPGWLRRAASSGIPRPSPCSASPRGRTSRPRGPSQRRG